MKYLYSKWNLKCRCAWHYTDPFITDLNGDPVEGTVAVSLSDQCQKHSNILKYLNWYNNFHSLSLTNKLSVELLRDLEWREKDNNLFPKRNRFDLIFDS